MSTIDVALVRKLVAAQFPQWKDLLIRLEIGEPTHGYPWKWSIYRIRNVEVMGL